MSDTINIGMFTLVHDGLCLGIEMYIYLVDACF